MGKCLASSPCFQNRNLSLSNHPTVGPEAILGHLLSNGKLGAVSFETAKEHLISPLSGTCPQRKWEQCQGDQNAGVRIYLCLYFWVLFLLFFPFQPSFPLLQLRCALHLTWNIAAFQQSPSPPPVVYDFPLAFNDMISLKVQWQ